MSTSSDLHFLLHYTHTLSLSLSLPPHPSLLFRTRGRCIGDAVLADHPRIAARCHPVSIVSALIEYGIVDHGVFSMVLRGDPLAADTISRAIGADPRKHDSSMHT